MCAAHQPSVPCCLVRCTPPWFCGQLYPVIDHAFLPARLLAHPVITLFLPTLTPWADTAAYKERRMVAALTKVRALGPLPLRQKVDDALWVSAFPMACNPDWEAIPGVFCSFAGVCTPCTPRYTHLFSRNADR